MANSPASIWGMSCEEAAKQLDFVDKIGKYTTCKHYEKDVFLDVTMMCGIDGKVTTLAVMWYAFAPEQAPDPLPPDHCR